MLSLVRRKKEKVTSCKDLHTITFLRDTRHHEIETRDLKGRVLYKLLTKLSFWLVAL